MEGGRDSLMEIPEMSPVRKIPWSHFLACGRIISIILSWSVNGIFPGKNTGVGFHFFLQGLIVGGWLKVDSMCYDVATTQLRTPSHVESYLRQAPESRIVHCGQQNWRPLVAPVSAKTPPPRRK